MLTHAADRTPVVKLDTSCSEHHGGPGGSTALTLTFHVRPPGSLRLLHGPAGNLVRLPGVVLRPWPADREQRRQGGVVLDPQPGLRGDQGRLGACSKPVSATGLANEA